MRKSTLKALREHALEDYPKEACGLVAIVNNKETYRRCLNVSPEPTESFVMDPAGYSDVDTIGEIVVVVHSHPNASAKPSEADLVMIEETELPWLIVSVYRDLVTGEMTAEDYTVTEPSGYKAPLIGRMWAPPKHDCYGLLISWFDQELGITLPDFEIEKRAGKWWEDPTNSSPYLDHFKEAGFVRVDDGPRRHDVILMEVASKAGPNHAAVYLGDETGHMLHHLYGRLSNRTVYGGYFLDRTCMVVRHKELK